MEIKEEKINIIKSLEPTIDVDRIIKLTSYIINHDKILKENKNNIIKKLQIDLKNECNKNK